MNNISSSHVKHMENENENENINSLLNTEKEKETTSDDQAITSNSESNQRIPQHNKPPIQCPFCDITFKKKYNLDKYYQKLFNKNTNGKVIKIHKFPKDHKVKLFRVTVSTNRTDYVITNDMDQDSLEAVQEEYGFRWKIEEFHREVKQVTVIEKCQCRRGRIQRNYIFYAITV